MTKRNKKEFGNDGKCRDDDGINGEKLTETDIDRYSEKLGID